MPVVSCIEEHPTAHTIQLGGRYVSLRRASAYTGVDEGYMSKMLSGKKDPARMSLNVAMQLAAAFGMSLDELIQAIYERAEALKLKNIKSQLFVEYLESRQQQQELAAARKGLPPPPRIPGLLK